MLTSIAGVQNYLKEALSSYRGSPVDDVPFQHGYEAALRELAKEVGAEVEPPVEKADAK